MAGTTSQDLSTEDMDLLVEIARKSAMKATSAAVAAMSAYADMVRQRVERRIGIPAGDERALDDIGYQMLLDMYASLTETERRF